MNNRLKGQVSLEIGFALICILLLMYGCWNVFVWVNNRIITRQVRYENGRSGNTGQQVSVSDLPKLDIFAKP